MFRDRDALARSPAHGLALDCLAAGVRAAHPERVVRRAVALEDDVLRVGEHAVSLGDVQRVLVLGGGNAAAVVAAALADILGDRLDGGVVVTDEPRPVPGVTVHEGAHPVPDEGGAAGARALLEAADAADAETLVLAVVTGGGSALLPAPAGPVSLADLRTVTTALLEAGAPIDDLNAVRKHLSALKGGRLARRLAPATTVGLVLSDVVGDDLGVVASGPLVADETTYQDALDALERHQVTAPASVRAHLEAGVAGEVPESPAPGDPALAEVRLAVLATNWTAVDAAREVAAARGLETMVLSTRIEGEARAAGATHAAVAAEALTTGDPVAPPAVLLSGGETTVTVRGDGTGGPNQEFAVGAGLSLAAAEVGPAVVAALDTDGRDGASDAAGGLVDGRTVTDRGAAEAALADNDAGPYLAARDGLLETGFTGTNVNDLRVVVLGAVGAGDGSDRGPG